MPGRLRVLFLPGQAPAAMIRSVSSPGGEDTDLVLLPERTTAALREALPHVDVVVGDWSGQLTLGEREAELGARLRLVQQPGTGVETIDLAAFARRGVPVANTGSVNASAVVEWCLGAALALLRPFARADAGIRAGRWPQAEIVDAAPGELAGRRVGVVGGGEIARRLTAMLTALGCEVAYWSPRSRVEGAERQELPDLFARSSLIVVAIARGPRTLGLVDDDLLAALGPRDALIDVSRGGIVDQQAVVDRLHRRALGAAALDVFVHEPFDVPADWATAPGLLLSPHVAGVTGEAMDRTCAVIERNLAAAVRCGPFIHVVNGEPSGR